MDAAVAHKDNLVINKYLSLLEESKILKVYIAKEMKKTPSLVEIEQYGKPLEYII